MLQTQTKWPIAEAGMTSTKSHRGRAPGLRPMRKAMNDSPDNTYHVPVLLEAVMQYMAPEKGKTIVDGTLGGGGHSEAMLKAGARVIGIDQDEQALAFAQQRLGVFDGAFTALRGNFSKLPSILANAGVEKVDGILVDIGVSSWQLDEAERGFSFGKEGPLDMRMDRSVGETAADWVNHRSEQELKTLFYEFGEERAGAKIARRIVARRQQKAFTTTTDLADFIASIIPRGKGPRGKIHPATRVFQALRIAVNDELGVLRELLASAAALLHPGGRLLVITFHSLEDRIVKQFFKKVSQRYIDRKEWPEPRLNPDFEYQLITRRPVIATDDEIQSNKRSRSAKLRVVEKI